MKRIHTIGLLLTLVLMLMLGSPLMAAVYTLPDDIGANGTPFKDCSPPPPGLVFSCTKKVDIKAGDSVVLVSNVTLNINDEFKISPGGSVDNSGFVFNVSATSTREERAAGVMMLPIPRAGVLHEIRGLEAARAVSGIEARRWFLPPRTRPRPRRRIGGWP